MTGGLVILYTASGGTEAVSKTHLLQMMIITAGMGAAFYMIFQRLPDDISFSNAVHVAGKLGKLNVINFAFDWKDRYNFWSGLIGGGFLALSYFGTDQSQVQRYLTGRSIAESRKGLLANGVLKVPMQFIILFIGAMIFVFYQFVTPPLFFNPVETAAVKSSAYGERLYGPRSRLRPAERGEAGADPEDALRDRGEKDRGRGGRAPGAPPDEGIRARPPDGGHRAHQEKKSPGRDQRHQLHLPELRDQVSCRRGWWG